MREFIAFDMEDTSTARGMLQDSFFSDRCVRQVGGDELHLTLNFLGEVDPSVNGSIEEAMEEAASGFPSYHIDFKGVGAFPSQERPSVIWIGVADRGETAMLNAILSERLAKLGFKPESRPFHPHLTVARVKCRVDPSLLTSFFEKWAGMEFGSQNVRKVVLKKSDLTPEGARHTPLYSTRLRT